MDWVVGFGIKIIHSLKKYWHTIVKPLYFPVKERGEVMNRLVYFLMVGLAFTVLQVSTVAAQTGASGAPMCDSNLACDPSDPAANCCAGMCDPNPACVADDPNAIPCCGPMDGPPPGEDCANKPTPEETAACWDQQGGHTDHPGDHPPGDHPPGEDCANKPTPEETAACWDQQGGHTDHPGDHPPGDPGCDPNLAPDVEGGCPDGFQGKPGGPPHHDGPDGHHDGPPIDPRSGQPFTKADEDKFQKYADECEATKGLLSEGSTQELVAEGFTRIQVEKLCKDGPEHHGGEHHDGKGPDGHHDGEHHDGPGGK